MSDHAKTSSIRPTSRRAIHGGLLGAMVMCALLATLMAVPVAQASKAKVGEFGAPAGEIGGELRSPRGIAVNSTGAGGVAVGDVYVADSANNRIQEFSATGTFVRAFGRNVVASGPDKGAPNNEVQSLVVKASSGTFRLSARDSLGNTQTTGPLAFNASAATVEAALNGLSGVGGPVVSVSVSGGPGDATGSKPYVVTFDGSFANRDVEQIAVDASSLGGTAAVTTTDDGGSYEICTSADVCKAGEAAASAGALFGPQGIAIDQFNGNVYVTDIDGDGFQNHYRVDVYSAVGAFEGAFGWDVDAASPKQELQFCTFTTGCQAGSKGGGAGEFGDGTTSLPSVGPNGDLYVPDGGNLRLDQFAPILDGSGEVTGVSFVRALGWDVVESGPDNVPAVTAVQKLTIPSAVTGGTFTLTFAGQTTKTPLPYNLTAVALSKALNELGSVVGDDGGHITVNGKGVGVFELVFDGGLEDVPVPQITVDSSKLTGGEATVSSIAAGVSPYEQCDVAANPTDVCKQGIEGGNLGEFSQGDPTSVAVASTGAIYTVDQSDAGVCGGVSPCRVLKFDPSGNLPEEFAPAQLTGKGEVEAVEPTDVAVDPADDHVLVAKKEGREGVRFIEFDSSGKLLDASPSEGSVLSTEAGSSRIDHGLAIGPGGRFYFANALGMVDIFGPPPAPTVTIAPATSIGSTTADFHGTVTPPAPVGGEYFDTTYHFEYSVDGLTWSRFPATEVNVGNGSGSGAPGTCPIGNPPMCIVEQTATGLQPGVVYEVRLVATTGTAAVSTTMSFETEAAAPSISATVAEEVSQTSAKLVGLVDPDNDASTYLFQWGLTAAYGNETPLLSVGSGGESEKVSAAISGLQAGTVYHFRIVASNAFGTTDGPDQAFDTLDTAGLPDNRAPEQVSANDKRPVGQVSQIAAGQIAVQAALDGNSTLYPVLNGLAGATAGGNLEYVAERAASGWLSKQLSAPALVPLSVNISTGADQPSNVVYSSPDLSCGFISSYGPLTSDAPAEDIEKGVINLYRYNADGTYTLVSAPVPQNLPLPVTGVNPLHLDGASADCRDVLFESQYKLLANAPPDNDNARGALYEWADGTLRVAALRQDGSSPPVGEVSSELVNAVSQDGSKAFFVAPSDQGGDSGHRAVFVRENGASTVDASQSQTATANDGDSNYQMASADGSRVFFTARYGLAHNATSNGSTSCNGSGGAGCDLYSYDIGTETLVDLSADTNSADKKGAGVAGVVDASDDGSYVYFAAAGQLVAEKGETEGQNLSGPGSYNIYLSHNGAISFVGVIGKGDMAGSSMGSDAVTGFSAWVADATPDGAHLLFVSKANVTGYVSGGELEAYLYSAGTGQTVCVSCRADGQPAHPGVGGGEIEPIASQQQTEARTGGTAGTVVRPRALSDDGSRVFFKTYDALAPGAVEGRRNFYEWEDGQVYLLMSGEGDAADPSEYLDAGANGDDVFLRTNEQLVPEDFDNTTDVYDLRAPHSLGEVVSFPASPSPPPPCDPLDEGCQSKATPQPGAEAGQASEVFSGPGNPQMAPKKPIHKKKPVHKKKPAHKKPGHKKKAVHRKKSAHAKKTRRSNHREVANNKRRAAR